MANQSGLWKKRVLIPFWIVRICIMLFLIGIYAYALRAVDGVEEFAKPATASIVVFMLFIIICLLIDILAIVLYMRDALKPGTFLTMNCFQTGFFGGVLIMDLVAVMRGTSAAGVGFSIFVFLTFVSLLVYSAVGYYRAKKQAQRGNYAVAHNPAVYNPAMLTAYAPQYQGAPPYQQNTAYYPQTAAPIELQHNHYLPPYQAHGATTDYYNQQPLKPAHMV
ncbi:hypothetical protein BU25DRAFT_31985 [Macroventuria anomochaeta]|uniref:Uncharacterized protein n=1 Tax=Macroventuria anomochaeta TaxID=301207 RepID=A0ACB6S485_9PLEO|nr:uncharacterized protein BU25DRAFT_31985 [Macroventuria anomochaeta]KAF2628768.1 hypothetical protein BU25DRAFT_31985 [Macroventuria anomochaeta]